MGAWASGTYIGSSKHPFAFHVGTWFDSVFRAVFDPARYAPRASLTPSLYLQLPVFVFVVLFFALLISYPWPVLTLGTLAYLGSLPFGWLAYRDHERKAAADQRTAQAGAPAPMQTQPLSAAHPEPPTNSERPARLN